MLIMAKAMPMEMLVDQLDKAIQDYKQDPSDKNKAKLGTMCILFNSKEVIESTGGDVLNTIKDFSEKRKVMDMVDMKNNIS